MTIGRKRWLWIKLIFGSIFALIAAGRLFSMVAFDLSVEEPLFRVTVLIMMTSIASNAADELRSSEKPLL